MWKKHLSKIVYEYNLAKHPATNKKPFRLLYQYPGYNTVFDVTEIEEEEEVIWEPLIEASYLDKMDKHSCVHLSKHALSEGNCVLVSNDFDKNTKTKKINPIVFISEETVILKIISSNIALITRDNKEETVPISRQKINKSFHA
ncbi:hypothetical protein NGRA_2928 [Nosema granulosis]|uniref:Uncharacterized protein n=1 Tax=Nosema granulosis TaxID=83296 RepID=A0A9P6GVP7_9MICR|nr:hypothetical protein NGRA_2928 [Nosema granulosis]